MYRGWILHLSVAALAIVAMVFALTPALADPLPGTDEYTEVAFLARNDVPFDAQTAASMAAQLGAPMFITDPNRLSSAAANGIADVNPDVVIVAGGTAAISKQVATEAAAVCDPNCTIDRYGGLGRDETAALLAGIADKYGFERPVLQGGNQVVGDVHIGGAVHADAITVQDAGLVSGLNADLLDGNDSTEVLPLAWTQEDSTREGSIERNSGGIEVNSINIAVPTDGLLLVSGTIFVANLGMAQDYVAVPRLDGAEAGGGPPWAARMKLGAQGDIAASVTLSYTVPVQVTAGTHTLTQELQPFRDTGDFIWNANSLSAQFYPTGSATSSSASLGTQSSDTFDDG